MSAPSGIGVSQELVDAFSSAINSQSTRFLQISIQNESLVLDQSIPTAGSFTDDLGKLQDVLEDNAPAYVLARLDDPPTEWLAIYYVPDSAKVRDKMLYAATRNSLMKSLGSSYFTDSIFATSKDDLTADAYASHRRHINAPQPLSAREQEMADIKAAEREASGGSYEGSRARRNHIGQGLHGVVWSDDASHAVHTLSEGQGCSLVVLTIDASETLCLRSSSDLTIDQLGASLPPSEPCFAVLAWPHSYPSPCREIFWIYSCPSSSPVKNRMLYSASSLTSFIAAKPVLESSPTSKVSSRKIETSDPTELDEAFLVSYLGLQTESSSSSGVVATDVPHPNESDEKKAFARPKGPARRR